MKFTKLYFLLIILGFATPTPLFALTTSGSATAVIAAPIIINEISQMSFGKFAAGVTSGTVTLSAAASTNRTFSGVSVLANPTPSAGIFTVSGVSGATYSISLPSSITLFSGGNTMTVDTFTSNPNSTGTLTGGTQTLYIGARLNVGALQATGTYIGTYTVTVVYQ